MSLIHVHLRARSHDTGTKLCRHKMNTVCNCSHHVGFKFVFSSCLNFTLFTVDNIYHSQNVSSNRNETVTVTFSHRAETVEFRYGFKLAFRFETLTVNVTVSHFFMPVSCERNP